MKLLLEVRLRSRNNRLHSGDDPDYDPDHAPEVGRLCMPHYVQTRRHTVSPIMVASY